MNNHAMTAILTASVAANVVVLAAAVWLCVWLGSAVRPPAPKPDRDDWWRRGEAAPEWMFDDSDND